MSARFHPFTSVAVGSALAAVAYAPLQPVVAVVAAFVAYGLTLLEFKKYTSRFQFVMLLVCGGLMGLLLDIQRGGLPFLTLSMLLAAVTTDLRQAYMPRFTYVGRLWVEPALIGLAVGGYLAVVLPVPFAWEVVLPPLLPLGFAGSLSFGYIQDGRLMRRQTRNGYRIQVGAPAPDFELPDQDGNPVRLSAHIGRHPVLLIFVRGDWCPGCHMMLRTYERSRERFLEKGVHVIGIGPDSVDVNRDMVERIGVGYQLLSDSEQRISRRYGVVYNNPLIETAIDYAQGIPLPASFLLDTDGMVRYVSRPDRVGEFLDPALIFGVLDQLPGEGASAWRAA